MFFLSAYDDVPITTGATTIRLNRYYETEKLSVSECNIIFEDPLGGGPTTDEVQGEHVPVPKRPTD